MRKITLLLLFVTASAFADRIRPDQPLAPMQTGGEQAGGSIATNGTLSLVAWRETSASGQSVARAAFVAADGELSAPIDLGGAAPQSNTALASNGRDFLVSYVDSRYRLVARRVTLEGLGEQTPILISDYGFAKDHLAIGWSGQVYIVMTAGETAVTFSTVTAAGTMTRLQGVATHDPADAPAVSCGGAGCSATWHTLTAWNGASLFVPTENNNLALIDATGSVVSQVVLTDLVNVTPIVSIPAEGRSLFVYSYGQKIYAGRITAGGLVLDPPALNGGVSIMKVRSTAFSPQSVAVVRGSGLYLIDRTSNDSGHLYWSRIDSEPSPHVPFIFDMHEDVTLPLPLTASARNTYFIYSSGAGDATLPAHRLYLRTLETPDPKYSPEKRRSAH